MDFIILETVQRRATRKKKKKREGFKKLHKKVERLTSSGKDYHNQDNSLQVFTSSVK